MEAIEEELMALESIFYDSFTKIEHNRFRVRVDPSTDEAVESEPPSVPPLFIDLLLPSSYPDQQIPLFDVSNLNNASYSELAKKHIVQGLQEQASILIGESMCYSILEWLKDKLPEFHSMRAVSAPEGVEGFNTAHPQSDRKDANFGKKDTKEKLTKAQKRRFFDKFGAAAEKPRGWDWVSIISHLSQAAIELQINGLHGKNPN